jgi:hypothetical protein
VLSFHVLKTDVAGGDCPPGMAHTRRYPWSVRGTWQRIFEKVTGSPEPSEKVALESTHFTAPPCAGSGKGGIGTGDWRHEGWLGQQDMFKRMGA